MAKKYPVIGQTYKVHPQGKCKICGGNKSDFRVDVQFNYFRGQLPTAKARGFGTTLI